MFLQGMINQGPSPFDFSFTSALINISADRQNRLNNQQQARTPRTPGSFPMTPSGDDFMSPGMGSTPGQNPNLSSFREELQRDLQSDAIKPPEVGRSLAILS